jgi:hypothetical protein
MPMAVRYGARDPCGWRVDTYERKSHADLVDVCEGKVFGVRDLGCAISSFLAGTLSTAAMARSVDPPLSPRTDIAVDIFLTRCLQTSNMSAESTRDQIVAGENRAALGPLVTRS